jgi:hypothetical protein
MAASYMHGSSTEKERVHIQNGTIKPPVASFYP